MKTLIKIQIAAFVFFTINCSSAKSNISEIKEEYLLKNEKYQAELISTTILKKEDTEKFKVSNLVDSDSKTVWFLQAGYKGELKFIFKKPVYIKKIIIKNNIDSVHFSTYKTEREKIKLSMYKDDYTVMNEGFLYNYENDKIIQEINFPNHLTTSILKTKILTIGIDDNFAKDLEGIFIENISIEITDKPFFKPSLALSKIKNKYVKEDDKPWLMRSPKTKYSLKQLLIIEEEEKKVLRNLIFYSFGGNKLAEKIFYNYSPSGASEGEYLSFLKEWYEMEKNK